MGTGRSKYPQPFIIGQTEADIHFLRKNLHYTVREVDILYRAFRKIDVRKNHLVEFDEYCARIRCEPTLFLRQLFTFFSSVQTDPRSRTSVALNFAEFVLFTTFFLTLHERGIAKYLFLVLTDSNYNMKTSGDVRMLTLRHIIKDIKELFGDHLIGGEKHIKRAMKVVDDDENGVVTEVEFIDGCVGNKSMLFAPIAVQVRCKKDIWVIDSVLTENALQSVNSQLDMRQKIVGKSFWKAKKGLGDELLADDKIKKLRDELCGLHVSERVTRKARRSRSDEDEARQEAAIESEFSNIDDIHIGLSGSRDSH